PQPPRGLQAATSLRDRRRVAAQRERQGRQGRASPAIHQRHGGAFTRMSTTSRPPHSLTVDHVIDERPISALQIRVIVLCSLVAFVDGFDLQTMALAVPTLIEVWELPAAAFGYAQSASLVGMAIGSVFLGPLGDRLGRKPVMIGGLIFMGGASLGVIFSTEPNHLVFWRTLVGIGYGTIHGNATAL